MIVCIEILRKYILVMELLCTCFTTYSYSCCFPLHLGKDHSPPLSDLWNIINWIFFNRCHDNCMIQFGKRAFSFVRRKTTSYQNDCTLVDHCILIFLHSKYFNLSTFHLFWYIYIPSILIYLYFYQVIPLVQGKTENIIEYCILYPQIFYIFKNCYLHFNVMIESNDS